MAFLTWRSYAPRVRSRDPGQKAFADVSLAEGPLAVRLWIPYPHQNLAVLSGNPTEVVAELFLLAGRRPPSLPRFLIFSIPPASEMVVALDPDQDRYVLAFRLDPLVALAVRGAGWLSSNPWLKGGDVPMGRRRARVGWEGRIWWVASSQPEFRKADTKGGSCLARLELGRQWGALPPGGYSLREDANERGLLRILTDGGLPQDDPSPPGPGLKVALAALEIDDDRRRGLILLDKRGSREEIPAAVFRPRSRPSESGKTLLEDLDIQLSGRALEGDWEILALSPWAADNAEPAGAWLLERWQNQGRASRRLEVLVRPGPALKWADGVLRTARRLRLVERERYDAWRRLTDMVGYSASCREVHFLALPAEARVEGYVDCRSSD
jgi:hypothetical protein